MKWLTLSPFFRPSQRKCGEISHISFVLNFHISTESCCFWYAVRIAGSIRFKTRFQWQTAQCLGEEYSRNTSSVSFFPMRKGHTYTHNLLKHKNGWITWMMNNIILTWWPVIVSFRSSVYSGLPRSDRVMWIKIEITLFVRCTQSPTEIGLLFNPNPSSERHTRQMFHLAGT